MEIKGSSIVKAIQTVGLRTNEGFNEFIMTSDMSLNKYATKHLYYYVDADHNLTLPDATTLDTGWVVSIYSKDVSAGSITVKDFAGNTVGEIRPGKFASFILTENKNGDSVPIPAGVWKNIATAASGGGAGGFRNVVECSTGPVITISGNTATVGNFVATVADGFESDGTQNDTTVEITTPQTFTYTSGTAAFFYVKPDGTIIKENYRQTGGEVLNAATPYPNGTIYYSISDSRNYKKVSGEWVEYPCVAIGEITTDTVVTVYGFNFWWWLVDDLTTYSQMFYDADYATTSVQINHPCPDKNMLTVVVGNSVLLSNAYTYQPDYGTITFENPIEAGTHIEVRWYVPATVVGIEVSGSGSPGPVNYTTLNTITIEVPS